MDTPRKKLRVFVSYAREDKTHLGALLKHLQNLVDQGWIAPWTDQSFQAGDEWKPILSEELNSADVILLLISSDFMASKFIRTTELPKALERYDAGQVRIVPVLVRSVELQGSRIADFLISDN